METINLDDSANNSLYIIDESPNIEEKPKKQPFKKKRRSLRKKVVKKMKLEINKNTVKEQSTHCIMGGKVASDYSMTCEPVAVIDVNQMKDKLDTIVIDDEAQDSYDSDSVIVLSDDEAIGIIGGELSPVVRTAQKKLNVFQRRVNKVVKKKNNKNQPPVCIDLNDNEKNQPQVGNSERKLRPIAIDGSNVAFGHGRSIFSSQGIKICCDYFLKRGHKVKVFVPQFRRRHTATKDTHILDKLEKDGIIVFTPSRRVNGKNIVSYDDRMMVDYAAQSGAIIVTRDNLQDIASESEEYKKIINERILMFTWVDAEIILFPQDPLGRNGPKLDDFLSFSQENKMEKKS